MTTKPHTTDCAPTNRSTLRAFTPLAVGLAIVGWSFPAAAEQPADIEPDTTVMLEIDPLPFALRGHAAHVRVATEKLPGWVFSAGIYGLEIPGFLTDINSKNRDEGWKPEIRNAYALFADYHFSGRPQGLFVGLQLAYQDFGLTRESTAESREFGVLMAMARVGTLWKPFDSSFYILPWAGVAANLPVNDGNLTLGDDTYDVAPVGGFVTLHLGWQL